MRAAARFQAVIDILTALEATDQPADRLLRDWFRTRRYAGSKDRAAIADRVFAIQRQRAVLAWRMQANDPRALVIASILCDSEAPEAYFTGDGYGPLPLSEDEKKAIAAAPSQAPLHVRGVFPEFLESELSRAFGDHLLDEMAALQSRAPVDLRANTLKASREDVLAALRAEGFTAEPMRHAPNGLRIPSGDGSAKLGRGMLFEAGAFEFQDEAAQIAALLCAAKCGQKILDLTAGAGGKALALAAAIQNDGEVVASDIRADALEQLRLRANRAGASCIRVEANPVGPFDAVLLDAPCSGTGTWRRQPELRWRLTPQSLDARMHVQDSLLDRAATLVQPGGRLIYATCSILPCENEDRVAAFVTRHRDFMPLLAAEVWQESAGAAPPPGLADVFKASPFASQMDGFFAAILIHNPASARSLDKPQR